MRSNVYFLILLAFLLGSCKDMVPEGEAFQEINKEVQAVEVYLENSPQDTLYFTSNARLVFLDDNYERQILAVKVYLDGELVGEEQATGAEYGWDVDYELDISQYTHGYHQLTCEVFVNAGTGSLADNVGGEGTVSLIEKVVFLQPEIPSISFTSSAIINDTLRLNWTPTPVYDLDYYLISDYYGTASYVFTDSTLGQWGDHTYYGGERKYKMSIKVNYYLRASYSNKYYEVNFPVLTSPIQSERISRELVKVSWGKPTIKRDFEAYLVDRFRYTDSGLKSNLNDTSFQYSIVLFESSQFDHDIEVHRTDGSYKWVKSSQDVIHQLFPESLESGEFYSSPFDPDVLIRYALLSDKDVFQLISIKDQSVLKELVVDNGTQYGLSADRNRILIIDDAKVKLVSTQNLSVTETPIEFTANNASALSVAQINRGLIKNYNTTWVYDLESGDVLLELDNSLYSITPEFLSPSGKYAFGYHSYNGDIKVWNLETGEEYPAFSLNNYDDEKYYLLHPTQDYLMCGTSAGIEFYNFENQLVKTINVGTAQGIYDLEYDISSNLLLGRDGDVVHMYDLTSSELKFSLPIYYWTSNVKFQDHYLYTNDFDAPNSYKEIFALFDYAF